MFNDKHVMPGWRDQKTSRWILPAHCTGAKCGQKKQQHTHMKAQEVHAQSVERHQAPDGSTSRISETTGASLKMVPTITDRLCIRQAQCIGLLPQQQLWLEIKLMQSFLNLQQNVSNTVHSSATNQRPATAFLRPCDAKPWQLLSKIKINISVQLTFLGFQVTSTRRGKFRKAPFTG